MVKNWDSISQSRIVDLTSTFVQFASICSAMKDRLSRMQLAVLQIFVYKVDQGRVQQKAYNYNCIDLYSNLVW